MGGEKAGRQGRSVVREQFAELYGLHGTWWRELARSHAGSVGLGDEAFAEAMSKTCGRLDELDEITWVYVIRTIRGVVGALDTKARKRRVRESEAALERVLHRAGPERPDAFTARAELRGRLTTALGELPEEHRRVIEVDRAGRPHAARHRCGAEGERTEGPGRPEGGFGDAL